LRKKVRSTCVSEGDFSFVSLSFVAVWTKESEKHLQGVFQMCGKGKFSFGYFSFVALDKRK